MRITVIRGVLLFSSLALTSNSCNPAEFRARSSKNDAGKKNPDGKGEGEGNFDRAPTKKTPKRGNDQGKRNIGDLREGRGLDPKGNIDGGGDREGADLDNFSDSTTSDSGLDIADSVSSICAKNDTKEDLQILRFPRNFGQTCPAGGENVPRKSHGYHKHSPTAIRVQDAHIELPRGAVLCSIALESKVPSLTYDDGLILTFEDLFLASANYTEKDFEKRDMEKVGDLTKFDWLKLRGAYPLGGKAGCPKRGICTMPISEVPGRFAIEAPEEFMDLMPTEYLRKRKMKISLIVTGNQNSSTDCSHTGVEMNATLRYAIP